MLRETKVKKMFEPLIAEFSTCLLDFTDGLLEDIMYPSGAPTDLIISNTPVPQEHINLSENPCLGHPILFEIVALRNRITRLQSLHPVDYTPTFFNSHARKFLIDVERLFLYIDEKLHGDSRINTRCHVNTLLLREANEVCFSKIAAQFDQFNRIVECVANANKSASGDRATEEPARALSMIFLLDCVKLHNDIIKAGNVLNDYLLSLHNGIIIDTVPSLKEDLAFTAFKNHRKNLLHLDKRRAI
ncbi:uncharacterized protein KNAG_0F02430 [Huiozyma naganishii CBS 8797]|uniref:Uncharacterized protein n=1 Tax=Huiozyma naganishii (strain ATCC MYA-139 / BCRC 22969 / CBS 8797 / KCTC 17520 / NBRC 10181 / NCYC 3082 / Yp74L-3) TaxID=1071383 RepID=J7RMW9_HUIN7|nr:hypothetical protein KNAG_0F02430 [Kazachstania naganishii CBS 8797]CCK70908.1 hypothetical protein KNAG_0F02430 [Kazachstania naganishii CBS 8797]